MKNISISKAIFAGISGTIAMTLMMVIAPVMGLPKMDIPMMLAGVMKTSIGIGWAAHFMIGTILALLYAAVFYNLLPGPGFVRGMIYSLLPWLMAQLLVMPMMMVMQGMPFSAGLFSGSFIMALGSLIGHLVYGFVVGIIYLPAAVGVVSAPSGT